MANLGVKKPPTKVEVRFQTGLEKKTPLVPQSCKALVLATQELVQRQEMLQDCRLTHL